MTDFKHCHRCNRDITDESGINIITLVGLVLRVFCDRCYANREKDFLHLILYRPNVPINGKAHRLHVRLWTFLYLPFLLAILFGAVSESDNIVRTIFLYAFILLLIGQTGWWWVLLFRTRDYIL